MVTQTEQFLSSIQTWSLCHPSGSLKTYTLAHTSVSFGESAVAHVSTVIFKEHVENILLSPIYSTYQPWE